jgi:plastocyanin
MMRRLIAVGMMTGGLIALLWIPTAALAGGGCHGDATQQDATGQDAVTVVMQDTCFQASITTIDPGTDVAFVNEDQGISHNVGGVLWGNYEDMNFGDTYTATFDEAGVYPFACSYHPGMTGAIVVGDGKGAGNGLAVSSTPPELDPVPADAAQPRSDVRWVAAAAVGGLAVGAASAFAAARRLRRPTAA